MIVPLAIEDDELIPSSYFSVNLLKKRIGHKGRYIDWSALTTVSPEHVRMNESSPHIIIWMYF